MYKILLVEDNEMNSDMLCRRLRRQEYQVSVASDGQQALNMLSLVQPDLVLMDLSLPGINGWEATRTIKGDKATQHIPIIVLTAHALKTDRADAFNAGCDDFDVKPIDFPRLLGKIEALINDSDTGN